MKIKLPTKFKSRKFWITILAPVIISILEANGIKIPAELYTLLGISVGTYNIGEGIADAFAKKK
jgi:uncharacterized membrane protein